MKIKKHINGNEYALSKGGHWVRNFTKSVIKGVDINNLIPYEDTKIMIANEMKNQEQVRSKIEDTDFVHPKVVVVGDGYDFERAVQIIESLPSDVTIIGVNGAFAKWNSSRRLNYFVVNNPYEECMGYFPSRLQAWPKCIASTRTYPDFLRHYQGLVHMYGPVKDQFYSGVTNEIDNFVDDYRNPACAAISLAYKFKVRKLLLLSLVELYNKSRPYTDKVKDLWVYPQQKAAHWLIDTSLFWLQNAKIETAYSCNSLDYEFASYINEDNVKRFFQ